MVETFRVTVARPELWEHDFTVSPKNLVTPEERRSMPGEVDRIVWTGGDATLEMVCFIDWTGSKCFALEIDDIFKILSEASGEEGRKLIIAVGELLITILLAAASGDCWAGRIVLYVGVNLNVRSWLTSRLTAWRGSSSSC